MQLSHLHNHISCWCFLVAFEVFATKIFRKIILEMWDFDVVVAFFWLNTVDVAVVVVFHPPNTWFRAPKHGVDITFLDKTDIFIS